RSRVDHGARRTSRLVVKQVRFRECGSVQLSSLRGPRRRADPLRRPRLRARLPAGLLFRRMLPAMLTALVGFIAAREALAAWVRPHLFTPLHQSLPITTATPVSIDQTSPGVIKAFENTR